MIMTERYWLEQKMKHSSSQCFKMSLLGGKSVFYLSVSLAAGSVSLIQNNLFENYIYCLNPDE